MKRSRSLDGLAAAPLVEGAIHRPRQVEQVAEGAGGVEVVLHFLVEERLRASNRFPERAARRRAVARGPGFRALERTAQPRVGGGGFGQPLGAELDRAPVV